MNEWIGSWSTAIGLLTVEFASLTPVADAAAVPWTFILWQDGVTSEWTASVATLWLGPARSSDVTEQAAESARAVRYQHGVTKMRLLF